MMAAASPGFSERPTFESTASGPAAVGYCLEMFWTSSMCPSPERLHHVLVDLRRPFNSVVLANTLLAAAAELLAQRAVAPQPAERIGQRVGIVRRHEQPAAGPLDDLLERAAPRFDNRHAARHCLEQREAFRLVIGR